MSKLDKQMINNHNRARRLADKPAKLISDLTNNRFTANHASILTFVLHLPIGWLIISEHYLLAGILLPIIAILDVLDGSIARYQQKTSEFGSVLDASLDRLKEIVIYSAIAYQLATINSDSGVALASIALGLSVTASLVRARGEAALMSIKADKQMLNSIFNGGLFRYEIRTIVVSLGLISNHIEIALALIVIGGIHTFIDRLLQIRKAL